MNFLKKTWPILAAVLVGLILIVVDVCTRENVSDTAATEEMDYEAYAKQLVESSQIKVDDTIYTGVFSDTEITSVPEGYTLYGVIEECVGLDGELVNNLSSNSITEGYEVYTNPGTNSIYLRVTTDEDEIQSYIEYQAN